MFFTPKNHINNYSDHELISGYKKSEEASYAAELFRRYQHLVFGICMKYLKNQEESRDAVMNIFEKLLEDLKKHDIINFKAWLHTVSKNHCLMFIRTNKKTSLFEEESGETFMELNYSLHHYEDMVSSSEQDFSKLDECMKKLIKEQKRCVELFYLEEKCYKEVAALTSYSLNEVKSYIQNGKRNLKNCMEGKK